MVVLNVEAFYFTMVPTFLFAKVILAVGLLQFGVSPIFLVLQDAEDRAGMPSAAGNGCNPFLVQLPGDDKAA